MNKTIPASFFCTLLLMFGFVSCVFAQKIKTIEHQILELQQGASEVSLIEKEFKEYDERKRVIKQISHKLNPGGQMVKMSEIQKSWNSEGLYQIKSIFDEMGDLVRNEKVQFNKRNKKLKEEFSEPISTPGESFSRVYSYNDAGKPAETSLKNKSGKEVGGEEWKYNKDDEEVRYQKWEDKKTGKYTQDKKTFYNKDGTLNKAEKSIKDGSDTYKEIIIFDGYKIKETSKYKNGQLVSSFGGAQPRSYDPNKAKTLVDFGGGFGGGGNKGMANPFNQFYFDSEEELDKEGRKIRITDKNDRGEIAVLTIFEYDDKGNVIRTKKTAYEGGEESVSEEEIAEYDEHNNPTRKAIYNNGKLISENKYAYKYQ